MLPTIRTCKYCRDPSLTESCPACAELAFVIGHAPPAKLRAVLNAFEHIFTYCHECGMPTWCAPRAADLFDMADVGTTRVFSHGYEFVCERCLGQAGDECDLPPNTKTWLDTSEPIRRDDT